MKIRMHRGGYPEAKETEETIPASMLAVCRYLYKQGWPEALTQGITITPYTNQPARGWDRHYLIAVNGIGPAAFCDEEVNHE